MSCFFAQSLVVPLHLTTTAFFENSPAMDFQPAKPVWRTREDLRRMHGRVFAERVIWQWMSRVDNELVVRVGKHGHYEFLVLEQGGLLCYVFGRDNRLHPTIVEF